jgi:hypothetical protein
MTMLATARTKGAPAVTMMALGRSQSVDRPKSLESDGTKLCWSSDRASRTRLAPRRPDPLGRTWGPFLGPKPNDFRPAQKPS